MSRPFCEVVMRDCEKAFSHYPINECLICIAEYQNRELRKIKDHLKLLINVRFGKTPQEETCEDLRRRGMCVHSEEVD